MHTIYNIFFCFQCFLNFRVRMLKVKRLEQKSYYTKGKISVRCNLGTHVVLCGAFYSRFFGTCCISNSYLRYKTAMCIKYVNFTNIITIIHLLDLIRLVNTTLFSCGIIPIHNYTTALDNYLCKLSILLFQ